ncbi:MAG: NAD(P)-binding protein [Actinobacteria bacterium]|uniref:Unannotated protein n=1 Tax=freshwater metagenome TaxID=449393 RepID=A0A6J6Q621_9ZZZZ|nr:NAD(P)-binding protein [Actinomycetota bacterium]
MTHQATTRPSSEPIDLATRTIAVVGGGASGVLTTWHLLASSPDPALRVLLFEGSGQPGRGVAYSTTDPRHLLNVRARDMSACPDEPSHFVAWAERAGRPVEPTGFQPRMVFGEYLTDLLAEVSGPRLEVVGHRVSDVVRRPGGFSVRSGAGEHAVESVVLAHGNAAPRSLAVDGVDLPEASWHVANPWDAAALAGLPDDASVVLVGSGLTAVDVAISLLEDAPRRRVVMLSRQGELPRPHRVDTFTAWVTAIPTGALRADDLADLVRAQVEAAARHDVDWRAVVDGLRGVTQSIWRRLDLEERRRFLAVHARQWEVHRHRMAPEVADRIAAYRSQGRLTLAGGGLTSVVAAGGRCRVALPGGDVVADALVNCTGPMTDVTRTCDPLLRALVERGTVAPDPLALGLSSTSGGLLLDRDGAVVPGLYAVGPPRKGALYESTAVPEIRVQAAELAAHLLATTS